MSIEESIQLAAGKADLAEELFSMLLEQLITDRDKLSRLWAAGNTEALIDCVHKLHGATRYCGVPELRTAANRLETGLKRTEPDLEGLLEQLLAAIDRLLAWSEQMDWQQLFREHRGEAETAS